MPEKPRTSPGAVACILLVTAILGAPSLLYPFARDQAIFAYIGDVWLRGGLPYRDAWDVKPPLIFLVYSFAQALFGHTMVAIRIVDLGCTAVTGLLLLSLGRKLGSLSAGLWAGLLYPILYYACWRFPDTAQSESFAAPLAVLLFLAAAQAREKGGSGIAVVAGLCVGLMALLKTTLVLYALPALAVVLWRQRSKAGLVGWAIVGTCIPLAITVGYFASQGATDTLRELIGAQAAYATPRFTWSEAFHHFGWFSFHWPLLVWAFAVGFASFADRKSRPAWLLGTVWLAIALANVLIQRRFLTYHAIPAAAPLALSAGFGLVAIGQWLGSCRSSAVRAAGVAAMAAVPMLLLLPAIDRYRMAADRWTGKLTEHAYLDRSMGPEEFVASEVVDTGRSIARITNPGDPVLIIGYEPMIYFVANRYSPTRHLSADPWLYEWQIDPRLRVRWTGELLRDTMARAPVALVVLGPRYLTLVPGAKDIWPDAATFRHRLYRKAESIGPYRIYRLSAGIVPSGTRSVESVYPIMQQAIEMGLAR